MVDAALHEVCDAVTVLVAAGVLDYNGHASCRIEDGFLINSGPSDRKAMTTEQVSRIAFDGSVMWGDRPPNEVALHAAIYAARPDVSAVVHGHPMWTTLFTAAGVAIPTVTPQGCLVAELPVHPQSHSISTADRGRAVAGLIGSGRGALLRSHGSVFVGADLREAAALAIYAEGNAERAYMARTLGGAAPIPADEAAEYRESLNKPGLFAKCWDFHLPRQGGADVR